jgi:hypothetical protein
MKLDEAREKEEMKDEALAKLFINTIPKYHD